MGKHNRRPDYWKYHHMAHVRESPFLIEAIADMVRKHPSPRPHAGRGRTPVHSKEKMDFAYWWWPATSRRGIWRANCGP